MAKGSYSQSIRDETPDIDEMTVSLRADLSCVTLKIKNFDANQIAAHAGGKPIEPTIESSIERARMGLEASHLRERLRILTQVER